MKLTADQVSEMTGFTPRTVIEYARRMGLGKIEGRRKYFTKAEARQIQSGELPKPTRRSASGRSRSKAKTSTRRR